MRPTSHRRPRTASGLCPLTSRRLRPRSLAADTADMLGSIGSETRHVEDDVLRSRPVRLLGGPALRRCGATLSGQARRRPPSGRPKASSTSSQRCSAWTPSPAASWCNRCWRSGCSSASTCHWKRRASTSSVQACWARCRFRLRHGLPDASVHNNSDAMRGLQVDDSILQLVDDVHPGISKRKCIIVQSVFVVPRPLPTPPVFRTPPP